MTNVLLLGCENVCFNEFAPISNVRLWGLQLLGIVLNIIGTLSAKADCSAVSRTNKVAQFQLACILYMFCIW